MAAEVRIKASYAATGPRIAEEHATTRLRPGALVLFGAAWLVISLVLTATSIPWSNPVSITVILLAAAIGLLWLTKGILGIQGDAVLIALLLIPAVAYLALTGKLGKLAIGSSLVIEFIQKIGTQVEAVSESEPERSTYRGKLRQVIEKDKRDFCLIYADVDGLRKISQKRYENERTTAPRRTEKQIRRDITELLALALTDAFYDANIDGAKQDIFFLEEPDVIMIARSVPPPQARKIAENARKLFSERLPSETTTIAVLAATEIEELKPQELDQKTRKRLENGKKDKGKVYDHD